MNNNKLNIYTTLLLIGMSLMSISACSDNKVPSEQGKGGQKRPNQGGKRAKVNATPVIVVNPVIDTATAYYSTTAALEPKSDAKINARSSGVVRQLLHEEGDDVERGTVLLQLEDDEQKLRALQAHQKYLSTEKEYLRLSKMRKAGVVPAKEYDAAEIAFQTAKTDKKLTELALYHTKVRAPFSGRLVTRNVDLGAYVAQGELLFRMMAIHPLLVRVYLPASRIGIASNGDEVELKIDSVAKPLFGQIELVSPIVDPGTGTIKITIRLDDYPTQVRPGDFTEVKVITDKHKNALLIPSVAVIEERDKKFIFVEQDNKAIRKTVESGFVVDSHTEIISGINEDDRVIIKGQRNLNDGVSVVVMANDS
ncbi:MAG: membrane fusion protein (multidrug efflux system) [Enterobacterales bacterium]|jgi:membrane fusion protein (multidrug efflux system)